MVADPCLTDEPMNSYTPSPSLQMKHSPILREIIIRLRAMFTTKHFRIYCTHAMPMTRPSLIEMWSANAIAWPPSDIT